MRPTLYELLAEALRRYTRFGFWKVQEGNPEPLTEAWTGLGSERQYRSALHGGYMELVHDRNPGYSVWLRLTSKGAAIVQVWIDGGFDYHNVEADESLPWPATIGKEEENDQPKDRG